MSDVDIKVAAFKTKCAQEQKDFLVTHAASGRRSSVAWQRPRWLAILAALESERVAAFVSNEPVLAAVQQSSAHSSEDQLRA